MLEHFVYHMRIDFCCYRYVAVSHQFFCNVQRHSRCLAVGAERVAQQIRLKVGSQHAFHNLIAVHLRAVCDIHLAAEVMPAVIEGVGVKRLVVILELNEHIFVVLTFELMFHQRNFQLIRYRNFSSRSGFRFGFAYGKNAVLEINPVPFHPSGFDGAQSTVEHGHHHCACVVSLRRFKNHCAFFVGYRTALSFGNHRQHNVFGGIVGNQFLLQRFSQNSPQRHPEFHRELF